MGSYRRELVLDLPERQSAFLWGPRKTGKSTLLAERFPGSARFDLLETRTALDFTREPWLFTERVLALDGSRRSRPIVVDEVQKVPAVLDEVHRLIERHGLAFVLCGSSARKLKRGGANLLGGRAWRFGLHPLAWPEVPELDLLRALNRGGLVPQHYDAAHHRRALAGYVDVYLKEEVFAEGLTRNASAFARFFDALGFCHGQVLNFSNVARDCGVDAKTVREYFQILVDTLLGEFVEPFSRRRSRAVLVRAAEVLSLRRRGGRLPERAPPGPRRGTGIRAGPGALCLDGDPGLSELPRAGRPDPVLANEVRPGGGLRARSRGRGGHRSEGHEPRPPGRHEGHPRVP